MFLRPMVYTLFILSFILTYSDNSNAELIYHEISYPEGSGPFPAVITLHTSGGFKPTKKNIENYKSKVWTDSGYAVYAPDFFKKHGLTPRTRMKTFSSYREDIEKELLAIVKLMKSDKKIDSKNIFAVGFSNGGFWARFLAGQSAVNAGSSHYGVWKANMGRDITNPYPMKYFTKTSSPILALHGEDDGTQKMHHVEQAWEEVRGNGAKLITHVYPGADHAWDSKSKRFDAWNPEVKEDSYKRTISFFKKYMR
ncbi:MAG: dienelactone hydrolase family protein [Rhodospirillales bacterium]